ncbi:hypothetical protein ACFYVL_31775 [Streptomyces sp. NPDC004111]|uniref:hypothetical protein n=1 Tax=Streptomyces sp. NPDC004111 TaxID=3364690 RepID=UPI0036ABD0F0
MSHRHHRDYDLDALPLPHPGPLYADLSGAIPADSVTPLVPFYAADEQGPLAVVRMDAPSVDELSAVKDAVDQGRCLLVSDLNSYPTYPIMTFSLFLYDRPEGPLRLEGFPDVALADIQHFVAAVGRHGGHGRVMLYSGYPAEYVTTGWFTLKLPPFRDVLFPHEVNAEHLQRFWAMYRHAVDLRGRIPEEHRDHTQAVATHMETEPPL